MDLSAKYTSEAEQLKPENKDKIVVSDDAYAICEMIDNLVNNLDRLGRHFK